MPEKKIIAVVGGAMLSWASHGREVASITRGQSSKILILSGSCWNEGFQLWNLFDKIEVREFPFLLRKSCCLIQSLAL